MPTKIEWVVNPDGTQGETWNVSMGCTPVSKGCRNCYARTMIKRFAGKPGWPNSLEEVKLFPKRIELPFRWKKPKTIFVNSMSDLFHESVPMNYRLEVFDYAQQASLQNGHIFMFLTKRPRNMLDTVNRWLDGGICGAMPDSFWFGVSVENQETADARIPILLQTPVVKRFVSCEPLLGPLDFGYYWPCWRCVCGVETRVLDDDTYCNCDIWEMQDWQYQIGLDRVVVGAETGPGKRPMNLDWARSIRDQCLNAGVPFFFKKDSDGNRELDGKVWTGQHPQEKSSDNQTMNMAAWR